MHKEEDEEEKGRHTSLLLLLLLPLHAPHLVGAGQAVCWCYEALSYMVL